MSLYSCPNCHTVFDYDPFSEAEQMVASLLCNRCLRPGSETYVALRPVVNATVKLETYQQLRQWSAPGEFSTHEIPLAQLAIQITDECMAILESTAVIPTPLPPRYDSARARLKIRILEILKR